MKTWKQLTFMATIAIIALAYTFTACDNGNENVSGNGPGSGTLPEQLSTEERWGSWFDPTSTVTIAHSVDNDGVCTITVGGTPLTALPAWDYLWKATAQYAYTATAGKMYAYTFEAWTNGGNRTMNIQWYEDNAAKVYDGTEYLNEAPTFTITNERKSYTTTGSKPIPKSGTQHLSFQCANQTGTFYVKIISIEETNIQHEGGGGNNNPPGVDPPGGGTPGGGTPGGGTPGGSTPGVDPPGGGTPGGGNLGGGSLSAWPSTAIAFGNGIFVADVDGDKISTSTDGITWTTPTNNIVVKAIAFGNGRFIAGGIGGQMSYSSSDGQTWTAITDIPFGASADVLSIAYGNGKFVAGGTIGSKMVYSSDNGLTWQAVEGKVLGESEYSFLGDTAAVSALIYADGKFVAGGNKKTATSTDGVNWTAPTNISFGVRTIAYGGGKFVAGGSEGKMAISQDGATWTPVTDSTFGASIIYAIAYGGGKFIAGGYNGKMATSQDGETWTALADFGITDYGCVDSIAYGNGTFIAVGYTNGSEPLNSGKMVCIPE